MHTKRILQLLSLAALCLLLTSCLDSKLPLSDPNQSQADQRLAGLWRFNGQEGEVSYYHIGRWGDSLPKSVMRAIGITHANDGEIKAAGELLIFPTTIGDKSFLNVTGGQNEQIKLVEEKGWTPETVSSYWLFRYQVTGDTLTIRGIDGEAKQRAIESGKVKGTIEKQGRFGIKTVVFTDSTENLAKFFAEAGDDLYSQDAVRLERVK